MSSFELDFARFLNIEDIEQNYEALVHKMGPTRAAEKCGIARTTPRRWKEAEFIRPETKNKVLKACIEEVPLKTFEILAEKGKEKLGDLILTYLSIVYNQGLNEDNPKSFNEKFILFQELRRKFKGIISNTVQDHVRDMLQILLDKTDSMGFNYPRDDLSTITSKNLLEALPYLLEDMIIKKASLDTIAHQYRLDIAIPQTIHRAVSRIEQWTSQRVIAEIVKPVTSDSEWIVLTNETIQGNEGGTELDMFAFHISDDLGE